MTENSAGASYTPNRSRSIWSRLSKPARLFWVGLGAVGTIASAYSMVKAVIAPTTTVASLDQRTQSRLVRLVAEGEMTPAQATNLAQVMVGDAFGRSISADAVSLSSVDSGANYEAAIKNIATSPNAERREALAAMANPETRLDALQSLLDLADTPQALRDVAKLADPWDPVIAYEAYNSLYNRGEASPATFLYMARLAIRLERYDLAEKIVEKGITSYTTEGQFARFQLVKGRIADAQNRIGEAKGFYESSLNYLDKSEGFEGDWAVRVENMIKLAQINQKKLDLVASVDWIVQATQSLEKVNALFPDDDVTQARVSELAAEVTLIGSGIYDTLKDYESALDMAQRSVTLAGITARLDQSNLKSQLLLANSWVNLSRRQRWVDQTSNAEQSLEKAQSIFAGKLETQKELPQIRRLQAKIQRQRGAIANTYGQKQTARLHFDKAIAILEPLFESGQANTDDTRFVSNLREWIVSFVSDSDPAEAIFLSNLSIQSITELAISDPENALLRHELAFKIRDLATLYEARGDLAKAVELLEETIDLRTNLSEQETFAKRLQYRELIFLHASLAHLDPDTAHTQWSLANEYASDLQEAGGLDDADLWTVEETARMMEVTALSE